MEGREVMEGRARREEVCVQGGGEEEEEQEQDESEDWEDYGEGAVVTGERNRWESMN